jgi:hypothetical protein
MLVCALFAALLCAARADTFGSGTNSFAIDFVDIRDTNNAADTRLGQGSFGRGAVPYAYRISTCEIPESAIAKATAGGLTNVTAGRWPADRPAANISWYEAAAFVNWLNTNSGCQAAYDLVFSNGAWSMRLWDSTNAWSNGGTNLYRHKDARYFLPSEGEWYKAAFYNPAGSNYFLYPTASNSAPVSVAGGTNQGTAVYLRDSSQSPAAVTNAGGLSPYGTMGQGGNVWDWLETASDGTNNSPTESRKARGGLYFSQTASLESTAPAYDNSPTAEEFGTGFRVASAPAPSTNADLGGLSLGGVEFSPNFSSATTDYAAGVDTPVASIVVSPTVSDPTAVVTVNGSSNLDNPINLDFGPNTIFIVITAQDGKTVKTYTLIVTRAPDTTAPVIALLGANPTKIAVGASFTDPGATVTDNIDPPRTITGAGTVNPAVAGEYTLTYTATDSAGNSAAPVTRTVLVLAIPQNTATIDFGGAVQTAGDRLNVGFVGSPGGVATAGGGIRVARQGGVGMVYFPTGYGIGADSPTINEAGSSPDSSTRTTLSAREIFDDGTFGPSTASVTWSPATNQTITVTPDGVAQAGAVYENTTASFSATIAGKPATNFLTVLNTLPDNFGAWAGDTFDDAWEIAQGMTGAVNPNSQNNGIPAWQLYAMGFNPASSSASASATARVGTNSGYLTISYTRNPYATNYNFIPQEAGNLAVGFSNLIAPVSSTNLVNGVEQITTRGSVPISSTNRQFLRLQITRPQP